MALYSIYLNKKTQKELQNFVSKFTDNVKKNYIYSISECCDYLKKDYMDISTTDAKEFVNYLYDKNKSKEISLTTIKNILSQCRLFSTYIYEHVDDNYVIPFNSTMEPIKNSDVRLNDIPTYEELDQILKAAKDFSFGLFVIVSMVARMALSSSAILKLKISDIFFDKKNDLNKENKAYIIIRGTAKKKDRTIVLPDDIKQLLKKYIETCTHDMSTHLFLNKRGKALSLRMLDFYIEQAQNKYKMKKIFCIRNIKDRAMLDMISAGADIYDVSKYTGINPQRIEQYSGLKSKKCPPDLVHIRIIE